MPSGPPETAPESVVDSFPMPDYDPQGRKLTCSGCGEPIRRPRKGKQWHRPCYLQRWAARHRPPIRRPKRVHTEPSRAKRLEVYLEPEQLAALDEIRRVGGYASRSAALRAMLDAYRRSQA